MPSNAPTAASTRSTRDFLLAVVCLLAVLGLVFRRSFQTDQVLFSNDGPLGANMAQADYALSNLFGQWQDLNWLGGQTPGGFVSLTQALLASLGPILFAKLYAPVSLFVFGLSVWCFFRQMRFDPWVCLLGGLAAALGMNAFSISCWGLASWTIQRASSFLALAALGSSPDRHRVVKLILAGFCVGLGIMEGFDVGAIFSLYIGAFVVFQSWSQEGLPARKLALAFGRLALVAGCAAVFAAQALTALIGTQVKGVVGMQQDERTKQRRWDEATQWSLPKIETLRIVIPGLFGYRMTAPNGHLYKKSYWGALAEDPMLPEVMKALESPDEQARAQATQLAGRIQRRHTGSGEYAGVLVVLVAILGVAQTFRRKNNPFTSAERRFIWFWAAAAAISLLLAFGRNAPFYQLVYSLPYFSTIRNPVKFLYPLHLALVILFGCGLQGLWRLYVAPGGAKLESLSTRLKNWWKTAPGFDRRWTIGSVLFLVASLFGWLLYASAKPRLVRHLQSIGFPDGQLADSMARTSINEVGLFVLFLGLSVLLITLIFSGAFARPRARWAGITLGLLLATDLVRANLPWIVYYDYKEKYASNPVIDLLRQNPYEGRVTAELAPRFRRYFDNDPNQTFPTLYYEWLQSLFQYYRVHSLDIIQMPRTPEFDEAFMANFRPTNPTNFFECGRLWELTSTRYLLGMTRVLDYTLNHQIDPDKKRFRVHTTFNLAPKPGVTAATRLEEITAVPDSNGQYALFEFTGAMSRTKLFTRWHVSTNDTITLERLRDPAFDPVQTVLVANDLPASTAATNATNQISGTVELAHYSPKVIKLSTEATASSVLLLNDRYHPDWKVWVDGRPETVLRCNYIMRGVYLAPGKHLVEFRFEPPTTALYISLASLAAAVGLCGFLVISKKSRASTHSNHPAVTPTGQLAPGSRPSK